MPATSRKLSAEVKKGVKISFCAHAGEWYRQVSNIVATSELAFFKIIKRSFVCSASRPVSLCSDCNRIRCFFLFLARILARVSRHFLFHFYSRNIAIDGNERQKKKSEEGGCVDGKKKGLERDAHCIYNCLVIRNIS